jgi:hypothetical protein
MRIVRDMLRYLRNLRRESLERFKKHPRDYRIMSAVMGTMSIVIGLIGLTAFIMLPNSLEPWALLWGLPGVLLSLGGGTWVVVRAFRKK